MKQRSKRSKGESIIIWQSFCRGWIAQAFRQSASPDRLQTRTLRLRRMYQPLPAASRSFSALKPTLETVVQGILKDWIKPDGSFRSRRLHFGWDNVPMHRWGQAQMFRSSRVLFARDCGTTAEERSESEIRGKRSRIAGRVGQMSDFK